MWLCLNKGFLSVVAHDTEKDKLLVRARVKGHIEAYFPKAKVFTDDKADYLYRAVIPRADVADMLLDQCQTMDYRNFKNSVGNRLLHDAYMEFWYVMFALQKKLAPVGKRLTPWRSKHPDQPPLGPQARR